MIRNSYLDQNFLGNVLVTHRKPTTVKIRVDLLLCLRCCIERLGILLAMKPADGIIGFNELGLLPVANDIILQARFLTVY